MGNIKDFDKKLNKMEEVNKNTELNNTDKKLHISDVMCRYISDEIKRHDCYINSLYRDKMCGDLTEEEYLGKLEYERNEVSLIIKGILEGDFDLVK